MASSAGYAEHLAFPALADDERFARTVDRNKNRVALRAILVDQLATRTSLDWFEELTKAGVPCGPINTIEAGMQLAEEFDLAPIVQAGIERSGHARSAQPDQHVRDASTVHPAPAYARRG